MPKYKDVLLFVTNWNARIVASSVQTDGGYIMNQPYQIIASQKEGSTELRMDLIPLEPFADKDTDLFLKNSDVRYALAPREEVMNAYVQHTSGILIPSAPKQLLKG